MRKPIVLMVITIVIGIITYFMFSMKQGNSSVLDFDSTNTQFRNVEQTNLSPYAMFGDSSVVLLTDAEKYGRQFIEIFNTDKLSEIYKIEFDQKAQKIRFYNKKGKLLKEELLAPEMIAKFLAVDPRAEKYAGWSPYNYVMGNPIRNIDPNGDTVRIVGTNRDFDWTPGSTYDVEADASDYDAFIAESVSALNALTTDETTANFTYHTRDRDVVLGNAILDYVGEGGLASKLITIKEADPHSSRHETGTVYWMPTEGMRMEHYTRGVMASVPPMMILLHEMGVSS
jgi:hypothetical protein